MVAGRMTSQATTVPCPSHGRSGCGPADNNFITSAEEEVVQSRRMQNAATRAFSISVIVKSSGTFGKPSFQALIVTCVMIISGPRPKEGGREAESRPHLASTRVTSTSTCSRVASHTVQHGHNDICKEKKTLQKVLKCFNAIKSHQL